MTNFQLGLEELYPALFYYKVTPETAETMSYIRAFYHKAGLAVIGNCPASHERDIAMRALEESLMRAIQSLAIHNAGSEMEA